MAINLQGAPKHQNNHGAFWSREEYRTPIHQCLAYFLIAVIIYGLVISFFQHCCQSFSPLSIYYAVKGFFSQTLFGFYMWMWHHVPETMRFTAVQTICLYALMIVISALLYDAALSEYEDETLVENMSSVILGALLAHVPVEFLLMQRNIENLILEQINTVFLNEFVVFSAMFYCLLRFQKLPILNIRLNRLMLIAGFITGLLFLFIFASFGMTGFYYYFPSVEPSKASMLLIKVFTLVFSLTITFILIGLFKLIRKIKNKKRGQVNKEVLEENAMAFVLEKIPIEEQKQFEDKEVWYRPERRWPLESDELITWCIDRERDIFSRLVGGSGRPGHSLLWVLCIKGVQVQYRSVQTSSYIVPGNKKDGFLVDLYIFDIDIPMEPNNQQTEIRQMIIEVCNIWFEDTNTFDLDQVKVHFSEPPIELMRD